MHTISLSLCVLVSAAVAQTSYPSSQGPLTGIRGVVSVTPATVPGSEGELLWKDEPFMSAPMARKSAALPGPGAPVFDARAMLFAPSTVWQQLLPATTPPARWLHAGAYNAARNRVVMFGGAFQNGGSVGYRNDTWEGDGTNWIAYSGSPTPSPRASASLVSLPGSPWVLLFGGTAGGPPLGDAWLWNGTVWSAAPSGGLAPRYGHAMVSYSIAGVNHCVMAFGGLSATPLGDTYVLDCPTMAWSSASAGPAPRFHHAMAFDPRRAPGWVVMFGGRAGSTPFSDTWEWSPVTRAWVARAPATVPPARYGHQIAYDTPSGKLLLFGGWGVGGAYLDDMWEWDATALNWLPVQPCARPSARGGTQMITALGGGVGLFGGQAASGGMSDTWSWGGSACAFDIDAMSIGQDFIPTNGEGLVTIANAWIACIFSVRSGTLGGTTDPTIQFENGTSGNGAGADLFSSVLEGSSCYPDGTVLTLPKRAADNTEMKLDNRAHDIDALDCFMPAYNLKPTYFLAGQEPPTAVTFYFSVTRATAGSIPAAWRGNDAPSGASVFATTWDPVGRRWSQPTTFVSYTALGLAATDDIDALAIDAWRAGRRYMVFSTAAAVTPQLKFANLLTDVQVHDFRYDNRLVEADWLLGGGNIDGICIIDPCNDGVAFPERRFFPWIHGVVQTAFPPIGPFQAAGAHRNVGPGGTDRLTTWTTNGPQLPNPAFLFLSATGGPPPWFALGAFPGNVSLPGWPATATLLIPPLPAVGVDLFLHWFELDPPHFLGVRPADVVRVKF